MACGNNHAADRLKSFLDWDTAALNTHDSTLHSPLGKTTEYPDLYNPGLLFPIPRLEKWAKLGLSPDSLPYLGVDVWSCYELSWLSASGKPVVAMAEFRVPADSPCMIESKSLKLYLNSFNQTVFEGVDQVVQALMQDLSCVAQAVVGVQVKTLAQAEAEGIAVLPGRCLDDFPASLSHYDTPNPDLLRCNGAVRGYFCWHTHLLRSNCPVTGQPDWGSLVVDYHGLALEPADLLAYIVSFRRHADFHEHCIERIFLDLWQRLQPDKLTVYARYVRRGGLDINPYRTTEKDFLAKLDSRRLVRQ